MSRLRAGAASDEDDRIAGRCCGRHAMKTGPARATAAAMCYLMKLQHQDLKAVRVIGSAAVTAMRCEDHAEADVDRRVGRRRER